MADVPAPLRVLVVDDHPDGADTLSAILRFAGYDVRLARTPGQSPGSRGASGSAAS